MKQVVFACFAHPDDEAFWVSGTLYKLAQAGADVHLLLITDGDAGRNPDDHANLGTVRLEEWRASAQLIGATSTTALGYQDGSLNNQQYLAVAGQLLHYVTTILSSYEEAEVTFFAYDPNGITGHLDHIASSMISTYVYLNLRTMQQRGLTLNRLKYVCIPQSIIHKANTKWLYMPRGRYPEEIDEVSDIHEIADKKLEIMRAHYTQRDDMKVNLDLSDNLLRHEYFMHYKD